MLKVCLFLACGHRTAPRDSVQYHANASVKLYHVVVGSSILGSMKRHSKQTCNSNLEMLTLSTFIFQQHGSKGNHVCVS